MNEPTRKHLQAQNILDLVLVNNRNIISDVDVIPGISDHDIVRSSITCGVEGNKALNKKYMLERNGTRIVSGKSYKRLPKILILHVRENLSMKNGMCLN